MCSNSIPCPEHKVPRLRLQAVPPTEEVMLNDSVTKSLTKVLAAISTRLHRRWSISRTNSNLHVAGQIEDERTVNSGS